MVLVLARPQYSQNPSPSSHLIILKSGAQNAEHTDTHRQTDTHTHTVYTIVLSSILLSFVIKKKCLI